MISFTSVADGANEEYEAKPKGKMDKLGKKVQVLVN